MLLIGLRGSGKSTLATLLARALDMAAVDLDNISAALLGYPNVRDAWAAAGEPAFRAAEVDALKRTITTPNSIIALGGGTPTAPNAEQVLLESNADILYLRATPATLRARLEAADNTDRPSLTGKNVLEEIEDVFNQRDALYQKLATRVIDVDDLTTAETVATILGTPRDNPA